MYYVGNTLAKSAIWRTLTVPSLCNCGEPPEDPAKAWFLAIQEQIGDLDDLDTTAKDNLVAAINEARNSGGSGGGGYTIGDGLKLDPDTNTLSVDTAEAVEEDNTRPVTSAAVYTEIGNINALLGAI